MHLTKEDLQLTERIRRLNLVNSLTGVKPVHLIGTISPEGFPNLAIFNSVVHLGSNPALMGFILRPTGEVPRHTWENILETGVFTINHVHESFFEKAHQTSAKYDRDVSEFDACGLTEEYLFDFPAPFVGESAIKIGLEWVDTIPIPINDTTLVIGEIRHVVLPDELMSESGHLDLSAIDDVGISGLNTYYRISKIATLPFARPEK
jgi:flavin reductase (DIM6/NTAB) family NADH-FMN oxidoreductase RutF